MLLYVDPTPARILSLRVLGAGICYTVFGLGAPLPALVSVVLRLTPMSVDRRQRITRWFIAGLSRFFIELMQFFRLYRYELVVNNTTSQQGQLIVANHPMLIDALFVLAYLPNVCCIAKPGLAQNPFTRLTLAQAGYVVSNSTDLVEQVCQKLAQGENVLIFPEGTRNLYHTQLDFRRGASNLAIIAGCKILPVVFYTWPRVLQKGQKWYQIPKARAVIRVVIEQSLNLQECIDTSVPRTKQYRALTQYLRNYYLERLSELDGQ